MAGGVNPGRDLMSRTIWIVLLVVLALVIGGFLLNVLAWFAIPAAIIVAIALAIGWARRKPRGPGEREFR